MNSWEEPTGRGCIFAVGGGFLEVYQMGEGDPRFDPAFTHPVAGDRIDAQLRADALEPWIEHLDGRWPFTGPERLPWGQRWIQLRDPDGLLIAIYEGEV